MTREEFCERHWGYYLILEKDFLEIERYISFELGNNYLYTNASKKTKAIDNSKCYSNEFIKQYQIICSEVDVVLKSICEEINVGSTADKMEDYTEEILNEWSDIVNQKVKVRGIELQPFMNWSRKPQYKSPDWWTPYNGVKHKRLQNYKKANLKNTMNSLAGLFILEQYFSRYIGNKTGEKDVPNDVSNLFEMVGFNTRYSVLGKNSYFDNNNGDMFINC